MVNKREDSFISKSFFELPSSDKLKIFAYFGSIAPSSHNTQPWFFQIEDGTIKIKPNFKRRLIHSDPNDRQLYLSVGAAVGYIALAAEAYGIDLIKTYEQTDQAGLVTTLTFGNLDILKHEFDQRLLQALYSRHTNRSPFEKTSIPENFIAAAQDSKIGDVTSVYFVTNPNKKMK